MKLPSLPDLSRLSSRERLLFAGVVLTMLVLLLDRVVLGPWWRHIQTVRRDITRLEGGIRSYQQVLIRKPQVMAQVEAYSAHLRHFGGEPFDIAVLLREIEKLGKDSGITLGEVKPLTGEADQAQETMTVEVHYSGSLNQWIQFVYLLQTSKSLLKVEQAAIASKEENPDLLEGSLRITCKGIQASVS